MSQINISSIPKITPSSLSSLILNQTPSSTSSPSPSSLAIIDVRDSDFIGGHILGCINVPTHTHDYKMPELVRTLKDTQTVVFHCALSQQRGPAAALRYLRERERLIGADEKKKDGQEQKVMVLEGGFVKWQELYGENKDLTEGYQKDIWEFGY